MKSILIQKNKSQSGKYILLDKNTYQKKAAKETPGPGFN
jgi:hypothetical protein